MARRKKPSRPTRRIIHKRQQRKVVRRKITRSPKRVVKRVRKISRTKNQSLAAQARAMAPYVPSLKKIKGRKSFTKKEAKKIEEFAETMHFGDHLFPIPKDKEKHYQRQLFGKGIRAIQLRGVADDAQIHFVGKDLHVTSNGKVWVYWALDRATVRSKKGMKGAAKKAFNMQFPIEKVAELARVAFEDLKAKEVHLWAHSGIVGVGMRSYKRFKDWVDEHWQSGRYLTIREKASGETYITADEADKWINGIALLVHEYKVYEHPVTKRKISELG